MPVHAGGGVVLSDDQCIMTIGVYTAHFTALQPDHSGSEQYCEDLPALGATLFTLDYLHPSLREVPVDFRIIRNVTGHGRFTKPEHVAAIDDLDAATVFYQAPVVRPGATLTVEYAFEEAGSYVGIVTAGHPSRDVVFESVFPFSVAERRWPWGWTLLALVLIGGVTAWRWRKRSAARGGLAA